MTNPRSASKPRTGSGRLTARQHQVIELAGEGHTSAEIGVMLGVTTATIDSHIRSAMERLGARTRQHAALLAAKEPTGSHQSMGS